jgi:hypothetical protein
VKISGPWLVATPFFLLASVLVSGIPSACAEDIVLAGKVVASITAPGDFKTVVQRASDIDKRICQAISVEDVGHPKMKIAVVGGKQAIYVGKTFIMKVYDADAKRYKVSAAQLAKTWAGRLSTLLPLAEPSIHMGSASVASEFAREEARTAAAANVTVPQRRWAAVSVVLDDLAAARAMSEKDFEQHLDQLTADLYGRASHCLVTERAATACPVPPHKPGACPETAGCPACRAAKTAALKGVCATPAADELSATIYRRIVGGLKLIRMVDEARYKRDRVMIASSMYQAIEKDVAAGASAAPR